MDVTHGSGTCSGLPIEPGHMPVFSISSVLANFAHAWRLDTMSTGLGRSGPLDVEGMGQCAILLVVAGSLRDSGMIGRPAVHPVLLGVIHFTTCAFSSLSVCGTTVLAE